MFNSFQKGIDMTDNTENRVPIWEKYSLTIDEASQYFGIGEKKLRKIVSDNPDAEYLLFNGVKTLFKRKKFEQFIDCVSTI